MRVLYADTSALVRCYFADEPEHDVLRELLLSGTDAVVSTHVARVEFASAVAGAARTARVGDPDVVLERFDAECQEAGPLTLLPLRPAEDLSIARTLLAQHSLRTLDAVHLAVALHVARPMAAGADFVFVTRDDQQAAAARALGLQVA